MRPGVTAVKDPALRSLKHILRALRYRNYRLFFSGQVISLVGTWMQSMAMGWLVYRLTNSAFFLGVIGFSSQVTTLFVTPFAGVWADRWNRRRILIITQTLSMIQALILAFLVISGKAQVWHIIALSVFMGLIVSFDMPVRQSFIIDMIEHKEDLGNAIALNSLIFNLARFAGPMAAGILVAAFGEGVCFLINGLSYIAVIAALLSMSIPRPRSSYDSPGVFASLKEGFNYTFGFPPMRLILILMALVSFIVMPYSVLLPAFARDTLRGNSLTLGFLMGATGIGAFAGAVMLASKKGVKGLGRIIPLAGLVFGSGLILLSFTRQVWLAMVLMVFIGLAMMVYVASSNTVLQVLSEDDKRGRVMSFYTAAFIGLTPFGSLLAGALAQSGLGTPRTILIVGLVCVCAALVFSSRMRRFNRVIDEADPSRV